MKTLRASTLLVLAMLAGSRIALADCPFNPDGSPLETLTDDVHAAANASEAPCTATLGDVIGAASQTPEGRAYAAALLAKLGEATGNPLSPEQVQGLLADPSAADKLLAVSIPQVVAAAKAVNARGNDAAPKAPSWSLPASADLGKFDDARTYAKRLANDPAWSETIETLTKVNFPSD